jgi:hypothetical protein
MTERESLLAMPRRVGAKCIWVGESTVSVWTGPDDAVAIFWFGEGGQLQSVEVDECGPCPIPGDLEER